MNTVFLVGAIALGIVSVALFIINKSKNSVRISNWCVVTVLLTVIMIFCLYFEVGKLFENERITTYTPVTTAEETTTYQGGRPVKDDSEAKTEKSETTKASSYQGKVYITRNGKKYHYSYTCGGNEYYECTLEQAIERGLEPCKRCVE